MARKLRIEYPGALYHVINRGNYRQDVFTSVGAAEAFVRTLAEATALQGWRVHAYVVMRNHYHVALETPQPNLVAGMHWLQGTLASRFNRFRREHGHLFQGRYHALLIEDTAALGRVVDYIHLNPVRAGLVAAEQVADFRWSSLRGLIKHAGFPGLTATDWLHHLGWKPTAKGWHHYVEHLVALSADQTRQDELGFATLSRGWCIGTAGWREAVARDHAQKQLSPGLPAAEARALRETAWEQALSTCLQAAHRTEAELQQAGKTTAWKVALAGQVRRQSGASVVWLARRMHLGTADTARTQLSLFQRRGSATD